MRVQLREVKSVIRRALKEDAVTAQQAGKQGLALMVLSEAHVSTYVLYNVWPAYDVFDARSKADQSSDINVSQETVDSVILASITTQRPAHPSNAASEVKLAAAVKGYGPMMYD